MDNLKFEIWKKNWKFVWERLEIWKKMEIRGKLKKLTVDNWKLGIGNSGEKNFKFGKCGNLEKI